MNENLVPDPNQLGSACFESFESIPKTGKPIKNTEWTVMSCIATYQHDTNEIDVIAIGTGKKSPNELICKLLNKFKILLPVFSMSIGTKCIGKCLLSRNGDTLNDSHAEIMCRRGFLRYLFEQIAQSFMDSPSIFTFDQTTKKFQLAKNISFHFFTTHAPCGDASIFKISTDQTEPVAKKPKLESHPSNNESIGDCVSFTGAKILYKSTDVAQDLMVQSTGEIRTKPGRGEPTCSASCSDKFAKWCILGMQGALISNLLEEPIYFGSLTLCNSKYCNVESIERAIWKRFDSSICLPFESFTVKKPIVQICQGTKFWFEKNDDYQPAAGSIVWCKTNKCPHQVAVNGKRLGVTKKKEKTRSGRLLISKIELFRCYLDILKNYNEKLCLYPIETDFNRLQYGDVKNASIEYQRVWNYLKENYFRIWPRKPHDLNKFTVD